MVPDKFESFTDRARRVMALAEEEARGFDHDYVGTEHLLLGLLREEEGVGARILGRLGVQLPLVREAIERIVGRGRSPVAGAIGLTPRAKRSIELALAEARGLKHNYVGTEHLLLGLLRVKEGVAAGVLESFGAPLARVRDEITRELAPQRRAKPFEEARDHIVLRTRTALGRPGEPVSARGNVVTCRIDDRDLDALDALVEAGIRSTRSDAAAWLIHAGIEAHRELFEKVYATVADIRGLRAEAQAIADRLAAACPAPAPPDETPAVEGR